jgi:hypothetical protein
LNPHSQVSLLCSMSLVGVPGGPQPAGSKRRAGAAGLEDAGERVARCLKPDGMHRRDLATIGFHPLNRGGLGIASNHVHEVAMDGKQNGVKLRRYQSVNIVKIPERNLSWMNMTWESN